MARTGGTDPGPYRVLQPLTMRGALAGQPEQLRTGRCLQRQHIRFVLHLQEGLHLRRLRPLRQAFQNAGHGWQRSVIGHQQHALHLRRRLPLVALAAGFNPRIRRQQADPIADTCLHGPARGGAGLAVQHEIDINFAHVRAQRTEGVGAHRRTLCVGQRAITRVPVLALRHLGGCLAGEREEHLDALIRPVGLHVGHIGRSEDHAGQRRRENSALLERDIEQAVGLLGSHAITLNCGGRGVRRGAYWLSWSTNWLAKAQDTPQSHNGNAATPALCAGVACMPLTRWA